MRACVRACFIASVRLQFILSWLALRRSVVFFGRHILLCPCGTTVWRIICVCTYVCFRTVNDGASSTLARLCTEKSSLSSLVFNASSSSRSRCEQEVAVLTHYTLYTVVHRWCLDAPPHARLTKKTRGGAFLLFFFC